MIWTDACDDYMCEAILTNLFTDKLCLLVYLRKLFGPVVEFILEICDVIWTDTCDDYMCEAILTNLFTDKLSQKLTAVFAISSLDGCTHGHIEKII